MKNRILALLLTGTLVFCNEGIISYAISNSDVVINENITEFSIETESETDSEVISEEESETEITESLTEEESETEITENLTEEESETEITESLTEEESGTEIVENLTEEESETEITENLTEEESETEITENLTEEESETETDIVIIAEASDDFIYTCTDNQITITGYKGKDSVVTFPSEIEGFQVVAIGNSAFKSNKIFKEVIIPDSVTTIGENAFNNCAKLEKITIGNKVTSIGNYAFYDCTYLRDVSFGSEVKQIGNSAFYNCTSLKKAELNNKAESIGDSAFYGCTSLESITIPDSVTAIGENAFNNCTKLESVSIGNSSFYNCTSLNGIKLNDGLESIGDSAFYKCTSLESIIVPDTVKAIGNSAFSQCTRLKSVTVGSDVSIGDYAFQNCEVLEEVIVGNNVTISKYAFDNSVALKMLVIGNNVTDYFVKVRFEIPGMETQIMYFPKGSKINSKKCPVIPNNLEQIWYEDEECVNTWEFEKNIVNDNIVLYAKGGYCTVYFDTACETVIDSYKVYQGNTISEPEVALEKEGYTLCGWTTDTAGNNDWNFESDKVFKNMTLYAKWVANERDKENKDTKICIEIVSPDSYVYTGKGITPQVIVRDGNKILEKNKDYKITYKNNVKACNKDDVSVKDSNKPQIIIQGIGIYKLNKKIVKYFSINQVEISNLNVEIPLYVTGKSNDKLQKIKPVVKYGTAIIPAKEYTIEYYKDSALKEKVEGLTKPGTYYIVIEAKKNNEGKYTGNYKGKTKAVVTNVIPAQNAISNIKVNINKNIKCDKTIQTSDLAVRTLISNMKIGNDVYETSGENLSVIKKYFEISAIDENGKIVSSNKLQLLLHTCGTKTLVITAKKGNDKDYAGEKRIKITVKGEKLNKNQFKITYDISSDKPVTATAYTGNAMIPNIVSDLYEGRDYTITYQYNKNTISESNVINAGTYTAVVKGINQYSGTVSLKFTISKCDLAKAYADKMLTISSEKKVEYDTKGTKIPYSITYDVDGTDKMTFKSVKLEEGKDYTVSYKNNKRGTLNSEDKAYGVIKGTGNFTGTLKGDGREYPKDKENVNGIARELNFDIEKKSFQSSDIHVEVYSVNYTKDKENNDICNVKFSVFDKGVKISPKEYKCMYEVWGEGKYIYMTIAAFQSSCYSNIKRINIPTNGRYIPGNTKIEFKDGENFYYTGSQIKPEIKVIDKNGNNITSRCRISYGENIDVGYGTIIISGNDAYSYYGTVVVKFKILPKWLQWIF